MAKMLLTVVDPTASRRMPRNGRAGRGDFAARLVRRWLGGPPLLLGATVPPIAVGRAGPGGLS
jgi:hypothetical protein